MDREIEKQAKEAFDKSPERGTTKFPFEWFALGYAAALAAGTLDGGSNYTADDDTFPTEVYFANGRKVGIAFDGDKPYLTVSHLSPAPDDGGMNERIS